MCRRCEGGTPGAKFAYGRRKLWEVDCVAHTACLMAKRFCKRAPRSPRHPPRPEKGVRQAPMA